MRIEKTTGDKVISIGRHFTTRSVRDGVFLLTRSMVCVCDILLCVGPFSYLIFNYLN